METNNKPMEFMDREAWKGFGQSIARGDESAVMQAMMNTTFTPTTRIVRVVDARSWTPTHNDA